VKLQRVDPKKGSTNLQVAAGDKGQSGRPIGVTQPRTGKFLAPQTLDRARAEVSRSEDPREHLANWITDPANEYFAGA
ncbi:hypothetical protein NL529_34125, partial [Klebsiella pneumoniae]|nr:hypothetical protein [Klebsiella pneumoniae]